MTGPGGAPAVAGGPRGAAGAGGGPGRGGGAAAPVPVPVPRVVDVDRCADETLRQCADVLVGTGGAGRAAWLLERYPGCLLVAVRRPGTPRAAAALRGGAAVAVRADGHHAAAGSGPGLGAVPVPGPGGPPDAARRGPDAAALTAAEHGTLVGFLHGWLAGGRAAASLDGAALRVGAGRVLRLSVSVAPDGAPAASGAADPGGYRPGTLAPGGAPGATGPRPRAVRPRGTTGGPSTSRG